MIIEYHRPATFKETLALLTRKTPITLPMGGGFFLNQVKNQEIAVVDLQALGLDTIHKTRDALIIGATVTLQSLLGNSHTPPVLKNALELEAPINQRNLATAAGSLVACDGRSSFATVMLAADALVTLVDSSMKSSQTPLGEILPLRQKTLEGKLITEISVPLGTRIAYEYVAKTPRDKPIVCAAVSLWPSGRIRLVVGGWGASPTLASDGKGESGCEAAATNAAFDSGDEWASAEYRREIAAVLAKRCLESTKSNAENHD